MIDRIAPLSVLFVLTAWPAVPLTGQQAPAVKTTTAGVLIDVSVLDRSGKPILDLRPEEFEVTENGQQQKLLSVTLVQSAASATAPAGSDMRQPPTGVATTPSVETPQQNAVTSAPAVTAIVFDRLSPEVRPVAQEAALAYVATMSGSHDYAGAFLTDAALQTLQPFTSEQQALRKAIAAVGSTAPMQRSADAERARSPRTHEFDPLHPPTADAESVGGFVTAQERERRLAEMDPVERKLLEIELRMVQSYRDFMTDYEGHASLAGLRAVVEAMTALPGRKSVLYFTEELPITSRLRPKFDLLIGLANRENVTFYPVDAAGLRVHSSESALARNVGVAAAQGVGDAKREDGPWTKELERQEQMLSSRPSAALGRLAKETGGFLIQNTNQLAAGVGRMQQDRTTYYLLAYQPSNTALDGKFRRVSVKVNRRGVTARARPGYLAAPR